MAKPYNHIRNRWKRADSDARYILRGKDFDEQWKRCGAISRSLISTEWHLVIRALKVREKQNGTL